MFPYEDWPRAALIPNDEVRSTKDLVMNMQALLALARRCPLSREGILWFIVSFAMLVTGLLKGINLITLLACWMVTVVLFNYWWAQPQLRSLVARRLFPDAAFAGSPCFVLLHVHNAGKKTALTSPAIATTS